MNTDRILSNLSPEDTAELAGAALDQLTDDAALAVVVAWARRAAEWVPGELAATLEEGEGT